MIKKCVVGRERDGRRGGTRLGVESIVCLYDTDITFGRGARCVAAVDVGVDLQNSMHTLGGIVYCSI